MNTLMMNNVYSEVIFIPSYFIITCYKLDMEEIMTQINHGPKGRIAVMVASHNEDTVRFSVEKWERTVLIL